MVPALLVSLPIIENYYIFRSYFKTKSDFRCCDWTFNGWAIIYFGMGLCLLRSDAIQLIRSTSKFLFSNTAQILLSIFIHTHIFYFYLCCRYFLV